MKILIAYYSKGGGTGRVAQSLKKEFEIRGNSVDVENIKPAKERGFWAWFFIRIFKGSCEIQPLIIKDVSKYDAVCIGSPNWTRIALPVAGYLKEVKGLRHKKIGFFSTTFFWPFFEWYIFSAYLLDLTFSQAVEKKGGRLVESILLSSFFRGWGAESSYGKRVIKNLCDKIEAPILSFKDYFLKQREVGETRFLIIIFSSALFFSFVFQVISTRIGPPVFTQNQYFYIFLVGLIAYFFMLIIMERRWGISLGKYLASIFLVTELTLVVLFLNPLPSRLIIFGYIMLFIFMSFSREFKAVLSAGLAAILSYAFLFFYYPQKEIFIPAEDLGIIIISLIIIIFVAKDLQKKYIDLLDVQDEIEMAKAALEIRVRARTIELKNLTENLEGQVKERTGELREKVKEMERFNMLATGRELKMVELKKEIKKLNQSKD